jgi:hypothetical protein
VIKPIRADLAGCVTEHRLGRRRSVGWRDGETRRPDLVAGPVRWICYVEACRGAHCVWEFYARAITETDAAIVEVELNQLRNGARRDESIVHKGHTVAV